MRRRNQRQGYAPKHFLVAEDTLGYQRYIKVKLKKRYPAVIVKTAVDGKAALKIFREWHAKGVRPIVISDLDMPATKISGWDLAREIKVIDPDALILIETAIYRSIKANVEGVIPKFDLLYLEYVIDLYEEEYLKRQARREKDIGGKSLGVVVTSELDEKVANTLVQNIDEGLRPAHLIVPASSLQNLNRDHASRILQNPNNILHIVWDMELSSGERFKHLESIGWAKWIGQKNFKLNIVHRRLDKLKNSAQQANLIGESLQKRGISQTQIVFLKPLTVQERALSVMSLRAGDHKGVLLPLMHYLIQIEGDPKNQVISGINLVFDHQSGEFTLVIQDEIARLISDQMATERLDIAA